MVVSWVRRDGCGGILGVVSKRAAEAAEALKLTAPDLERLGVVDAILPEPVGGAHRDAAGAAATLKQALLRHLDGLGGVSDMERVERRRLKFRRMGVFREGAA